MPFCDDVRDLEPVPSSHHISGTEDAQRSAAIEAALEWIANHDHEFFVVNPDEVGVYAGTTHHGGRGEWRGEVHDGSGRSIGDALIRLHVALARRV